jgi:hypothetical protein
MFKSFVTLAAVASLSACTLFEHNPDAGEPEKVNATTRSTQDVIACMTDAANKSGTPFKASPIPQGQMLDFGDSNIVKIRTEDDGRTSYRFYPGKRHADNLWIEGAGKICAGAQ